MTDASYVTLIVLAFLLGMAMPFIWRVAQDLMGQKRISEADAEAMNLPHPLTLQDDQVPPSPHGHLHRFEQVHAYHGTYGQRCLLHCKECDKTMWIAHRPRCVH